MYMQTCICGREDKKDKMNNTRKIEEDDSKRYCLIYGEFIECIEDEEQQERNVKQNDILIKK